MKGKQDEILKKMHTRVQWLHTYYQMVPGVEFKHLKRIHIFYNFTQCKHPASRDYCHYLCPGKAVTNRTDGSGRCIYKGEPGYEIFHITIEEPEILTDDLFEF